MHINLFLHNIDGFKACCWHFCRHDFILLPNDVTTDSNYLLAGSLFWLLHLSRRQCLSYEGVFMPTSPYDLSSSSRSQSSGMVGDVGEQTESLPLVAGSMEVINDKQLWQSYVEIIGLHPKKPERDFTGTPYVPVYVMLPLGVINMKCELVDPDSLLKQLRILKSINVDGVMVDCWWGIVEAHAPQEYNWNGYRRLFQMVHELKLKLQVVISFHEWGGNVGDDVCIPLPHWVAEIGRSNPDIYFTDKEGRRNPESLSWGIDKE
ncbi:hypothetical protein CRYUN_Cryun01aG0228400 [Craigia yunnanensis]